MVKSREKIAKLRVLYVNLCTTAARGNLPVYDVDYNRKIESIAKSRSRQTMALFKKTALGSAMLAVVATGLTYAESHAESKGESSHTENMGDTLRNTFISDGDLILELKNYYSKLIFKDPDATSKPYAWAQAAELYYSSGWLKGILGVDLATYYVLRLKEQTFGQNRALLLTKNGKSYGKQSYVARINLRNSGVLQYGRTQYHTPLVVSTTEYALPVLFQGLYGDYSWEGATLYTGYITQISPLEHSRFTPLAVRKDDGTEVNRPLFFYGMEYETDNLMLRGTSYRQRDASVYYYTDGDYRLSLAHMGELSLGGQVGRSKTLGITRSADEAVNFNHASINWWGGILHWTLNGLKAHIGYVKIEGLGNNYRANRAARARVAWSGPTFTTFSGYTGRSTPFANQFIGYTSTLTLDFANPGTQSVQLGAKYDFSSLLTDGLYAYGAYTFAKQRYVANVSSLKHNAIDAGISYHIPMIQGLSASLQYGRGLTRDFVDSTYTTRMKNVTTDIRAILTYTLVLL